MKRLLFALPLFLFFLAGCDDDSDVISFPPETCGTPIIIALSNDFPPSDGFTLVDHSVEGTCLTVRIGASGCSDEGWSLDLRTNGSVAESLPTQTNARLIFDDGVPGGGASCLAYFEQEHVFDLSEYLDEGALPTLLTLTGPDAETRVVGFE